MEGGDIGCVDLRPVCGAYGLVDSDITNNRGNEEVEEAMNLIERSDNEVTQPC